MYNSYVLYKIETEDYPKKSHIDFLKQSIEYLSGLKHNHLNASDNVSKKIKNDCEIERIPDNKRRRCRDCVSDPKKKTFYQCKICLIPLCISKCFYNHYKKCETDSDEENNHL